ncbi:MobH family relaxase [Gallibacterium melopsittaci]|uniref:MobH family relaxase n=1 Tax=Gallibacterium melopsittaci TaxID=516063 RepID=A0ABV6HXV9_9PAST
MSIFKLLSLITLFLNKKKKQNTINHQEKIDTSTTEWLKPKLAAELLNTNHRRILLKKIYQSVSMSEENFDLLCLKPIEKYAELVQDFPASENHHHAYLGGMLDHTLDVIFIALKLRQSYLLPQNAKAEDQAQQSDIWTIIIFYSALIHDIAKIITDIHIDTYPNYQRWYPWQGKLANFYRFKYIPTRDYHLHPIMGSYMINYLLTALSLDWIAKYPDALSTFFYLSAGHYDKAGIVGEIIQKADQMSVAIHLGGDISRLEKPQQSFANQLTIALRYITTHDLILNNQHGGSDGWLTNDSLWLISKTVTDKIRAYLMQQGISVPTQNSKLFDEMQTHKIIEATPDNKAIWHCHVKSHDGWSPQNSFTLLRLSPSLIWEHIEKRPPIFNGTVTVIQEINNMTKKEDELIVSNETKTQDTSDNNQTDLFDFTLNLLSKNMNNTNNQDRSKNSSTNNKYNETITHNEVIYNDSKDKLSGECFLDWLKKSIVNESLSINEPKAKIHIINQHVFLVSPGIFQFYCQSKIGSSANEHWKLLQKNFQALGIHKKRQPGNYNIWKCEIKGPRRTSVLQGYIIEDIKLLTNKQLFDNMYLTLKDEDKEGTYDR